MNHTIITGCWLVIPIEGKRAWGDLWQYGTAYVFDPVLYAGGIPPKPSWDPLPADGHPINWGERAVILQDNAPYFERRGVLVFEEEQAVLNGTAEKYLRKYDGPK